MSKPDDPDNETLCHCSGTKRGQIRRLAQSGMDMHDIANMTGALTGCGGCEWEIEYFLKELEREAAAKAGK